MRPGLYNAQFLPSSVSSSHANWTVGAHDRCEKSSLWILELVHDWLHIGVNETEVHTETTPVVHQVNHLAPTLNLPASGQDSGKWGQMVDLGNTGSWCKPMVIRCEPYSRKDSPAARIEQHTRVALAGSMGLSRIVPRTPSHTM